MSIAEQVIEKCGGVANTARIVGRSQSWVYRWTYPKDKGGTGGRVPQSAQLKLLEAAGRGEINIQPVDFFPKVSA